MTDITPRQAEILAFMREHLERQQRLPSIRDIMARFEIGHPNGVVGHMEALRGKGLIEPANGLARGYRLAGVRVVLVEDTLDHPGGADPTAASVQRRS